MKVRIGGYSPAKLGLPRACAVFLVLAAGFGCRSSVDVDRQLASAESAVAEGNYAVALSELAPALRSAPDDARVRLLLAEAQLAVGDLLGAEHNLEAVRITHSAEDRWIEMRLRIWLEQGKAKEMLGLVQSSVDRLTEGERRAWEGEALAGLGRQEEAWTLLQDAGAEELLVPHVRLVRARVLLGLDMAAALEEARAGMGLPPDWTRVSLGLVAASVLAATGDLAEAERMLLAIDVPSRGASVDFLRLNIALAEIRFAAGNVEGAGEVIGALNRETSDLPAVRLLSARHALALGRPNDAAADLQKLLVRQPEHLQARSLLAVALTEAGSVRQAEQQLLWVLARDPENAVARKTLARSRVLQGRIDAAEAVLTPGAVAQDPEARALLGRIKLLLGQNSAAVNYLQGVLSDRPGDTAAAMDLAHAHLLAGEAELALAALERLAPPEDQQRRHNNLLFFARAMSSGLSGAGIREVESMVAEAPDDFDLRLHAAAYHAAQRRFSDAAIHLDRAQELSPANSGVHLARARLAVLAGDVDTARSQLEAALSIEADNVTALVGLARLALARGDRAGAQRWVDEMRRFAGSRVDLALLQIELEMGDLQAAQRSSEKLLSGSRDPAQGHYLAGLAYLERGFAPSAAAHFRELTRLRPDAADVWFNAARAELAAGEHGAARQSLLKTLEIRPGWLAAIRQLLAVHVAVNDVPAALRVVDEFRRSTGGGPVAQLLDADTRFALKRFDEAARAYSQIPSSSRDGGMMVRWAIARQRAGTAGSESPLVEWLKLHPQDLQARFVLAELHAAQGAAAAAEREYRAVLAAEPRNTLVLNNLAWLIGEAHPARRAEAIALARQAHQLAATQAAIKDTLGWLLVHNGQINEGLELLAQAASLEPENAEIARHLVDARKMASGT